MDAFIGGQDGSGCFVWHWFGVYGVAIVVVEDEELSVSRAGWDNEAAGLVCEDLAGGECWQAGGVTKVCALVGATVGSGERVFEQCFFGVIVFIDR